MLDDSIVQDLSATLNHPLQVRSPDQGLVLTDMGRTDMGHCDLASLDLMQPCLCIHSKQVQLLLSIKPGHSYSLDLMQPC